MVTMADVAERSGVSRSTVWAVLQGKTTVRKKNRLKVLEALRETGYQQRLVSGSLLSQFSQVVGVLIQNSGSPFFNEVIAALQAALQESGYSIMWHDSGGDGADEAKALERFAECQLGGLVVAPAQPDAPSPRIIQFAEEGKPLVTLGRVAGVAASYVDFEDRRGTRMATDYLLSKGHRRVAHLAGPEGGASADERILGFIEALLAAGVAFDDSMIERTYADPYTGHEAALKVLSQRRARPTALVCFNDLVAIAAYRAAHELGLHVPDDVSIIGFDGIALGAYIGPPLTTVSIAPRGVGEAAAELLLPQLKGESGKRPQNRMIEAELIERASVREA
jgi:LacI family transcriptional regulator